MSPKSGARPCRNQTQHGVKNRYPPGQFARPKWAHIAGPKWARIAGFLLFFTEKAPGATPAFGTICVLILGSFFFPSGLVFSEPAGFLFSSLRGTQLGWSRSRTAAAAATAPCPACAHFEHLKIRNTYGCCQFSLAVYYEQLLAIGGADGAGCRWAGSLGTIVRVHCARPKSITPRCFKAWKSETQTVQ